MDWYPAQTCPVYCLLVVLVSFLVPEEVSALVIDFGPAEPSPQG
jgi:hypothetical protein